MDLTSTSSPESHKQAEDSFVTHIDSLLQSGTLRIDTSRGRRAIRDFSLVVQRTDHASENKRVMIEKGSADRALESSLPLGIEIDVTLKQKRLFFFSHTAGALRIICTSPVRQLITEATVEGATVEPMSRDTLQKTIQDAKLNPHLPTTLVVLSTSGFTSDATDLAARESQRTVILVSPNTKGGWQITAPSETAADAKILDPEGNLEKIKRVITEIDRQRAELSSVGISADKLAGSVALPVSFVEDQLRAYAKKTPGLVSKRIDGRLVLYREGNAQNGGSTSMPFIDRVKSIFSRKGETEKKVALLSERRTALSQQRDRAYEEMANLEKREADLRQQFKDAPGDISRRRITSQTLQLRKDLDRRQQLISVLAQQIDIVSTHLHNLELVQQGQSAKLPNPDEIAADAEKAEEVLADLQASAEMAGERSTTTSTGMSTEEQALYDELMGSVEKPATEKPAHTQANSSQPSAEQNKSQPARAPEPKSEPRRAEPEIG